MTRMIRKSEARIVVPNSDTVLIPPETFTLRGITFNIENHSNTDTFVSYDSDDLNINRLGIFFYPSDTIVMLSMADGRVYEAHALAPNTRDIKYGIGDTLDQMEYDALMHKSFNSMVKSQRDKGIRKDTDTEMLVQLSNEMKRTGEHLNRYAGTVDDWIAYDYMSKSEYEVLYWGLEGIKDYIGTLQGLLRTANRNVNKSRRKR